MKPVEFEGCNVTFAKDHPEYLPLPAFRDSGQKGNVVSCWKLTFQERLKILFTGKLWLSLMMFGQPLTPQRPAVNKWEIFEKDIWLPYVQEIKQKKVKR